MIRPKRQRDRLTAKDWRELRNGLRATQLGSTTSGLNISQTTSGAVIENKDPLTPRPVYVVGFGNEGNEGSLLVKEAIHTPGSDVGFTIINDTSAIEIADPWPGYNSNHFVYDVIGPEDINTSTPFGYQPKPKDRVAIMEGGYVRPIRRMMLVEPADVASLCEPCAGAPSPLLPVAKRFPTNSALRALRERIAGGASNA